LFAEQHDVFQHASLRLAAAAFDRVADTREPLEVRRIEAEEVGMFSGFDGK
jgi:hypothetical protein